MCENNVRTSDKNKTTGGKKAQKKSPRVRTLMTVGHVYQTIRQTWSCAPLEAFHVDVGLINELDAVRFQKGDLLIAPAERERV